MKSPGPTVRAPARSACQGLIQIATPADFVARLSDEVEDYAPFNLVVGDVDEVWCVESPRRLRQRLGRGVHLVSNGPLDAPWPKMQRLRRGFEALIAGGAPRSDAALLDLLDDRTQAIDAELPDTGIPRERERFLSSVFVRSALYGTRASSLAWRDGAGRTGLIERRFGPGGERTGESVLD